MKTWNVRYCRIPTNYHDQQAALVEAETADDARTLVVRMLGDDRVGLNNYMVGKAEEYNPKPIAGRIIGAAPR